MKGLRVALVERPGAFRTPGSIAPELVAALERRGARVAVVCAEDGLHRVDVRPAWDVTILKSGSAAALHLAAVAEAWGIPSVNGAEATRLAQDKLASSAILERAGVPVARSRFGWLESRSAVRGLASAPLVVKAQRGSRGAGVWPVERGALGTLVETLGPGPYLLMERVPHAGDDLKVYVAGGWSSAIRRRYPASTLDEKRGTPAHLPGEVEAAARRAGEVLGLSCFGCDFVHGPDGWTLVDVNAFPGYKGADGAAEAIVAALAEERV